MPVFVEKSGDFARNLSPAAATESLRGTPASAADSARPAAEKGQAAGESGFLAFIKGVIDIVNPLHHIPVIGAIYRHVTGDEISPVARVAGDALWGGPLGALAGVADVVLEQATGKDTGATVMAMITRDAPAKEIPAPDTQLAAADILWHAETPDDTQELPQTVPDALIAVRMMDALDKYAAMKTEGDTAQSLPRAQKLYVAF